MLRPTVLKFDTLVYYQTPRLLNWENLILVNFKMVDSHQILGREITKTTVWCGLFEVTQIWHTD